MITELAGALLLVAAATCFTVAVIVTVRPVVRRLAGAQWSYALWLLLLIPVALALLPTIDWGYSPAFFEAHVSLSTLPEMISKSTGPASLSALGVCWAIGSAIMVTRLTGGYLSTRFQVLSEAVPASPGQQDYVGMLCSRVDLFPPPPVVITGRLTSPALLGVVAPTLVIPTDFFQRFSGPEQELMLRHEVEHLKRRDPYWNFLFCIFRCCFWFVPFLARVERRFRVDQELACDHAVTWDEPRSARAIYATAMLKSAASGVDTLLATPFLNTEHDLLKRAAELERHRKHWADTLLGVCTVGFLVAAVVLVAPQATRASDLQHSFGSWCSVYSELNR